MKKMKKSVEATPSSFYVIHATNCLRQKIQCLPVAGFFSKITHVVVFFVAVDKNTANQFLLDLIKVGPKIIG